MSANRVLPTGTVTFLFTDVEGSTRLLHELGPVGYASALALHRTVMREAFTAHGGVEVDTQGDAFFIAFANASSAVLAAAAAQQALVNGEIRVRIGIHTGTAQSSDEGYVGPDVHLAARICGVGHGGQVLLSAPTRVLIETAVTDLGEHRLKDFDDPAWIFQLGNDRFPPLNSISNTNLPRPTSSFVGRQREISEISALLNDGARLVSLTGPGGSGKTRLAIEAAAGLLPTFKSGVFWVNLAPLRDPALVAETVSQTIGAKQSLAAHIGPREMLLVLDNLEQVVEAAPVLVELVQSCPKLRVLATTRERLRVNGEVEYPVQALGRPDAVALFGERSALAPDSTMSELCAALDDLPLAIELAAARVSVLSPAQILERLSSRLDLLKGTRDADPRQRTLRATIAWSHDLLTPDEAQLFARMAVFRGGSSLESAEAVAGADLETLESLVDKSLVRRIDGRFWMLESIRAFAEERFVESHQSDAIRRRHADYFLELAEQMHGLLRRGEPEEGPVAVLDRELADLRAAVGYGLEVGDTMLVRRITACLPQLWFERGMYAEGRAWLERALALDAARDDTRRSLLASLGVLAYTQGDHERAVTASDEAAALAVELTGTDRYSQLRDIANAALHRGDLDEAAAAFRERLPLAIAMDNGVGTSACRINLAYIANQQHEYDMAEALMDENLPFVRSRGQARCEASTLAERAYTHLHVGHARASADDALLAAVRALQINDQPLTATALDLYAASVAAQGDRELAATILAATDAVRREMGVEPEPEEVEIREMAFAELDTGSEPVAAALQRGKRMDLQTVLVIAKGTSP